MSSECLAYREDSPQLDITRFKFDCGFYFAIENEHMYKMYESVDTLVLAAHKEGCPLAKKKFDQDNYYKNTQEQYGTAPKFPPGKPAPISGYNLYIGPGTGIAGDPLEAAGWKTLGYTTEDNINAWSNVKKAKLGYSNWHEHDDGYDDHGSYVHHTSSGSVYYAHSPYNPNYNSTTHGGRPPIDQMPGLRARVKHPVQGHDWYTLEQVVISLNDQYDWTRHQIADWLDTLDIDLSFKTETSV